MKQYISYKYTRGSNAMVVYLLDPEIENLVEDHQQRGVPVPEVDIDRILAAVDEEFGTLPATASIPTILTTVSIRRRVRDLIRAQFYFTAFGNSVTGRIPHVGVIRSRVYDQGKPPPRGESDLSQPRVQESTRNHL